MRSFVRRGWGQSKSISAIHSNLPLGLSWGSGYQNRFLNMSASQQDAALAKMIANGFTWARIDCEWWTVQPTSQAYVWTTVDTVVNKLRGAGINVVLLLNMCPNWAKDAANTAPLYVPNPTPNADNYAQFCADAVRHFSPLGVTVYELWNEPNLTSSTSPSGWAWQSVAGFGSLAVAAYSAMKAANPGCYVLAGTLATASRFGIAGVARACTWGSVSAGALTATINCATAISGEAPGFLSGTSWPTGTVITAVTPGVSYTVAPPPWTSGGFSAINAGSGTLQVQNLQLSPDFFLDRLYAYANGRPWCDALAIHPYVHPVTPSTQLAQFGGWNVVPTMRATMLANGDGRKPMWVTEIGAPTGSPSGASWSTVSIGAASFTVTCPLASIADLYYQFTGTGIPAGCWVSAVVNKTSWTISPATGLVLSSAIVAGTTITSLVVAATATPITIPSGTVLRVSPPVTSGNWVPTSFAVTTSGAVTTSTSAPTTIPVTSIVAPYAYPVGAVLLGNVGQTFGAAIQAASSQKVSLAAPGVPFVFGMVDEATQTAIILESLRSIVYGIPAGSGTNVGSPSWPYAYGAPVFIYCWADSNAGMFGLERVDGTDKSVLAALRQFNAIGV